MSYVFPVCPEAGQWSNQSLLQPRQHWWLWLPRLEWIPPGFCRPQFQILLRLWSWKGSFHLGHHLPLCHVVAGEPGERRSICTQWEIHGELGVADRFPGHCASSDLHGAVQVCTGQGQGHLFNQDVRLEIEMYVSSPVRFGRERLFLKVVAL